MCIRARVIRARTRERLTTTRTLEIDCNPTATHRNASPVCPLFFRPPLPLYGYARLLYSPSRGSGQARGREREREADEGLATLLSRLPISRFNRAIRQRERFARDLLRNSATSLLPSSPFLLALLLLLPPSLPPSQVLDRFSTNENGN